MFLNKRFLYQVLIVSCLFSIAGCAANQGHSNGRNVPNFDGVWEDAGNIGVTLIIHETEDRKIRGYVHFKNERNDGVLLPIENSSVNKEYAELEVPCGKSLESEPYNSISFEITLLYKDKIIGCMMDNLRKTSYDFVLTRIPGKRAKEIYKSVNEGITF